jgi:hypothetical protein
LSGLRRFLAANPFLFLGIVGVAIFGVWLALGLGPGDGGPGQALFWSWRVLAAPVHLAANLLAPFTDRWPDPLDAAAAVVAGLIPYIVADLAWRRIRARGSRHP